MKKLICAVLALVLCLGCSACGSAPAQQETAEASVAATVPETTEATEAETVPETQPQETVPVLAEPAGQLHKSPEYNYATWDAEGNNTDELEVYDCRIYPGENGTAIFAVDYKTVAGLQMVIYGFADDGDDEPNYWEEIETLTTDGEATLVFEMNNEVLDVIYHPGILFLDQSGRDVGLIEIFHREEVIYVTDGNPVGEPEKLVFTKEGKITVHSAYMQKLDNGYVRFTLECTPRKDLYICFYSDPEGQHFTRYSNGCTAGKKETIVADIWAEYVDGLHGFNFSFYKPNEYPESRVYLNSATANFDELAAYNFNGFINKAKQFSLVYYGILDEAVLGATMTAQDGTSVVITEDMLSRNGDGHSLVLFKEFKAKKNDTVTVTLSKEGYQDMVLELYVH